MSVATRPAKTLPNPGVYLVDQDFGGLFRVEAIHRKDGKTLLEIENCRNLGRCLLSPSEFRDQHFHVVER